MTQQREGLGAGRIGWSLPGTVFIGSITLAVGAFLAVGATSTVAFPTSMDLDLDHGGALSSDDPLYWIYVVAESEDEAYVIRWDGQEMTVDETIQVGRILGENEAPHGVDVSPHGDHWYVSIAHGFPRGYLRQYEVESNRVRGDVELDMFPSSLTVDPTGLFVFVVNSNFHGDMVPSSLSIVFTPDMVEMQRIETCTMPHGSRFDSTGLRHYSVCMMDDQLVEVDAQAMDVARRFALSSGSEGLLPVEFTGHHGVDHGDHDHHDHERQTPDHQSSHWEATCSPTWVQPSSDDRFAYVTCNRSGELLEVDLDSGEVSRRVSTPERPYNVDVSPDGRLLVVSHRKDPGLVTIWDRDQGSLLAEIATTRSHTHGIVVSPDSRFAFVTAEGVRGQSGVVEVIDLDSLELLETVHVGKQATGVSFWKMEASR